MLSIHPDARTTPAVRAGIARSAEPAGELARRYGVSTETVRKWRKRGPGDCLVYRPRLVRHRTGPYAARAAGESCSSLRAAGGRKPCRSISQVVL